MTSLVAFVHCCLNCTGFQCSIETACLFYGKEEFPRLFSDRHCQVLDIIRTGSRVDHLIKMRFFFQ